MNLSWVRRAGSGLTHQHRVLLCVFGVIFLLRLASVFFMRMRGFGFSPIQDPLEYWMLAKNLLAGHGFSIFTQEPYVAELLRTPAYPLFLIPFLLLDASGTLAILAQQGLAVLSGLFLYQIARQFHLSKKLALGVTILFLLEPFSWFASLQTMTETVFTVIIVATLWVMVKEYYKTMTGAVIVGLLSGMALLVKPSMVLFLPLIAFFLLFRTRNFVRGVTQAVVFCVIAGLVCVPWLVRNQRLIHTPVLSSSGPFNMVMGFGDSSEKAQILTDKNNGILTDQKGRTATAFAAYTVPAYPELERLQASVKEHLTLRTFVGNQLQCSPRVMLTQDAQVTFSILFHSLALQRLGSILYNSLLIVVYGLGLLGVVALLRTRTDRRAPLFALLAIGMIGATFFLNLCISYSRMRLPLMPLFFLLAGIGVASLWRWRGTKASPVVVTVNN